MTLIRVTKRPPAPVMDGFDVGHLEAGRIYHVSAALATYLKTAGYAVAAPAPPDHSSPERRKEPDKN